MTESLNDWLDTQAVALHGGSAKDPLVDAWLATGRPAEIALAKLHQRGELILAHKATGQPAWLQEETRQDFREMRKLFPEIARVFMSAMAISTAACPTIGNAGEAEVHVVRLMSGCVYGKVIKEEIPGTPQWNASVEELLDVDWTSCFLPCALVSSF